MKKYILVFVAISLIINLAFITTEYRDAVIGNYKCIGSHRIKNLKGSELFRDTVIIQISKDRLDSILDVRIGKNTFKVKLIGNSMIGYLGDEHCGGEFLEPNGVSFTGTPSPAQTFSYKGMKNN